MSECPPPAVVGDAAGRLPQALTPEAVEALLADFRAWLLQAVTADGAPPAPAVPETEPPDLHTLLGQFLALRHEVNLQTRAVRVQQEHSAESLKQLGQALDALHQVQEADRQAEAAEEDEQFRPLLKTLVDLADALGLARRELQRSRQAVETTLDQLAEQVEAAASAPPPSPPPSPIEPPRGLWPRWLGVRSSRPEAPEAPRSEGLLAAADQVYETSERTRELLEAIISGYTMSLQRVDRALRQHDLEPIPCVGQPFDPERMEVVEAVGDSGRPAGEVLEEVRPGYLWRGRVFRFALVRVARS